MKKKNLIVLLIIPFLISTLTIVTVNITYNMVDVDISYIEWDYDDIEAMQVSDEKTLLSATGVNRRYTDVGKGNELIWSVKNRDASEDVHAEIIEENGQYYLTTLSSGEVDVTCSNEKGNVSRSFLLVLYTTGAIIVSPTVKSSDYGKIDSTEYFGQYDLNSAGVKQTATFDVTVKLIPESLKDANPVLTTSDNIAINLSFESGTSSGGVYETKGSVTISGTGAADISVSTDLESEISGGRYEFEVIEDGVNVYTYDDLLNCTNRSEEGEIVVLHKSFESYDTYKAASDSSAACFGYPSASGKFTFSVSDGTVYKVETKYNHEYIDQWNDSHTSKLDTFVYAGLRVQKDFYGNGYAINFHNLAYPTSVSTGTDLPVPSDTDLFQGPLSFYTVGTPTGGVNNVGNIVTAYGQDNIGFYVDGDGITVNDVRVSNCDDVNIFASLNYVGTVVEVDGDGVTLENMRMSNGKNVLRSFSSLNLTVSNCMLSNAMNFLFITGSNEYKKVDDTAEVTLSTPYGSGGSVTTSLKNFLTADSIANTILNDYINGKYGASGDAYQTKAELSDTLTELQDSMSADLSGQYKGTTELKDCLFYRSGIASVAFESLFNGPFLYSSALPTSISTFLNLFNSGFMPENVSGTSYPVSVNVSGSTRFYDYKTFDEIDVSGLIKENISTLAQAFGINYTLDDIFPIKSLLQSNAVFYTDSETGKEYVNIPFAYYGGGANYSTVTFVGYENSSHINGRIDDSGVIDSAAIKNIDLLDKYLDLPRVDASSLLGSLLDKNQIQALGIEVDENTLIKTVTLVTGYEPFKFVFNKGDGYLYGESPKIEEMQTVANQSAVDTEAQNA